MNKYNTQQENFWAGEFGNEYVSRSQGEEIINSNIDFFKKALKKTNGIDTCIELGSNIGLNIRALKKIYPKQEHHVIEINEKAVSYLKEFISEDKIINDSIINFKPFQKWDLVLIKGVLIHVNPDLLEEVYTKLHNATDKYILIAEYYNRTPTAVEYRGFSERLFKRDFCGEIMDKFSDLKLIDYGFCYHRDNNFPQDDISWFLLKKDK